MAEVFSIDAAASPLTAATAKTVLEHSVGSTVTARYVEVTVGCDATATGTLKVELLSGTSGTGTSYTPKKVNADAQNRAAISTAKTNDSVEPTSITVLRTWMFILPMSSWTIQAPLGREQYIPSSTMYGLRFTSSVGSVNGFATLLFEE